ncbi:MAG: hypothetical protein MAG581_00693 [Deltaproteobacteria bacterium]|jgi:hypothetical protein|nr:hypothetical protein [Deltaproteobacteria bacterium]
MHIVSLTQPEEIDSWFASVIEAEPQFLPSVVFRQYALLPVNHRLAAYPGTNQ